MMKSQISGKRNFNDANHTLQGKVRLGKVRLGQVRLGKVRFNFNNELTTE